MRNVIPGLMSAKFYWRRNLITVFYLVCLCDRTVTSTQQVANFMKVHAASMILSLENATNFTLVSIGHTCACVCK